MKILYHFSFYIYTNHTYLYINRNKIEPSSEIKIKKRIHSIQSMKEEKRSKKSLAAGQRDFEETREKRKKKGRNALSLHHWLDKKSQRNKKHEMPKSCFPTQPEALLLFVTLLNLSRRFMCRWPPTSK